MSASESKRADIGKSTLDERVQKTVTTISHFIEALKKRDDSHYPAHARKLTKSSHGKKKENARSSLSSMPRVRDPYEFDSDSSQGFVSGECSSDEEEDEPNSEDDALINDGSDLGYESEDNELEEEEISDEEEEEDDEEEDDEGEEEEEEELVLSSDSDELQDSPDTRHISFSSIPGIKAARKVKPVAWGAPGYCSIHNILSAIAMSRIPVIGDVPTKWGETIAMGLGDARNAKPLSSKKNAGAAGFYHFSLLRKHVLAFLREKWIPGTPTVDFLEKITGIVDARKIGFFHAPEDEKEPCIVSGIPTVMRFRYVPFSGEKVYVPIATDSGNPDAELLCLFIKLWFTMDIVSDRIDTLVVKKWKGNIHSLERQRENLTLFKHRYAEVVASFIESYATILFDLIGVRLGLVSDIKVNIPILEKKNRKN